MSIKKCAMWEHCCYSQLITSAIWLDVGTNTFKHVLNWTWRCFRLKLVCSRWSTPRTAPGPWCRRLARVSAISPCQHGSGQCTSTRVFAPEIVETCYRVLYMHGHGARQTDALSKTMAEAGGKQLLYPTSLRSDDVKTDWGPVPEVQLASRLFEHQLWSAPIEWVKYRTLVGNCCCHVNVLCTW